jgi:hypothetical protein
MSTMNEKSEAAKVISPDSVEKKYELPVIENEIGGVTNTLESLRKEIESADTIDDPNIRAEALRRIADSYPDLFSEIKEEGTLDDYIEAIDIYSSIGKYSEVFDIFDKVMVENGDLTEANRARFEKVISGKISPDLGALVIDIFEKYGNDIAVMTDDDIFDFFEKHFSEKPLDTNLVRILTEALIEESDFSYQALEYITAVNSEYSESPLIFDTVVEILESKYQKMLDAGAETALSWEYETGSLKRILVNLNTAKVEIFIKDMLERGLPSDLSGSYTEALIENNPSSDNFEFAKRKIAEYWESSKGISYEIQAYYEAIAKSKYPESPHFLEDAFSDQEKSGVLDGYGFTDALIAFQKNYPTETEAILKNALSDEENRHRVIMMIVNASYSFSGFQEISLDILTSTKLSKNDLELLSTSVVTKIDFVKDDTSGIVLALLDRMNCTDLQKEKIKNIYGNDRFKSGQKVQKEYMEGFLAYLAINDGEAAIQNILSVMSDSPSREEIKSLQRIFRLSQVMKTSGMDIELSGSNLDEIYSSLVSDLGEKFGQRFSFGESISPEIFEQKMSEIIENNMLVVFMSLITNYETNYENKEQLTGLLKEIVEHYFIGDYRKWKYDTATEENRLQLESLSDDPERARQVWESWSSSNREVVVTTSGNANRLELLGSTLSSNLESLVGHMEKSVGISDFSDNALSQIEARLAEFIDQIKQTDAADAKKVLIDKRMELDQQKKILVGIRYLSSGQQDPRMIMESVQQIRNATKRLGGDNQLVENDLLNIERALEAAASGNKIQKSSEYRAYETDELEDLIQVGERPRATCQSWKSGGFNECLPAYLADGNKKLINVQNTNGEIVARSIIKLTHVSTPGGKRPVILFEGMYSSLEGNNPEVSQAMMTLLMKIASELGAGIVNGQAGAISEADMDGYDTVSSRVNVYVPKSRNIQEYSDSLGGRIRRDDQPKYKRFSGTVLLPKTA